MRNQELAPIERSGEAGQGPSRSQSPTGRKRRWPTRTKPSGPATPEQLAVLRRDATETGRTFDANISKVDASDLIERRFASNPKALRAHKRAESKRRRLDQQLVNPAAHWRFGDRQTVEQEQAEIRKARRDGLEAAYVLLQRKALALRAQRGRSGSERSSHRSR